MQRNSDQKRDGILYEKAVESHTSLLHKYLRDCPNPSKKCLPLFASCLEQLSRDRGHLEQLLEDKSDKQLVLVDRKLSALQALVARRLSALHQKIENSVDCDTIYYILRWRLTESIESFEQKHKKLEKRLKDIYALVAIYIIIVVIFGCIIIYME